MGKLGVSLCLMLSIFGSDVLAFEVDSYDLLMPNVYPHKDELYLCTPIRISPRDNFYIVGFEPNASMHTAHHMLLYGCSEPGLNDSVWSCGEMQSNEIDNIYQTASPCRSGSQIVYAWARDAPSLHLPKDVGFLIGEDSPIKYLVLQVHYMHRFEEGTTDNSGVFLKYTRQHMPRQAGVILLGTSGAVPARTVEHMETACTMREDKTIHPFAFRTHTHSLGKVVTGYVVRKEETGDVWTLLGKKDPQLPQMFYPVSDAAPVRRGDILAARCTMNNTLDHVVRIGATNKDEMCNFYLMYWVENDTPLDQKYCFSAGPPYYYWSRAIENFNRIPDKEASTLNKSVPPINQLLCALRFFATGNHLLAVADMGGISVATCSRIVKRVSQAIVTLQGEFIIFPDTEEQQSKLKQDFYKIARFPNVLGCIDCTHIKIQSPGGDDAEIFRNRKSYMSVNVQTISSSNLLIMDVVARWPGSTHDSAIYQNSRRYARFERGDYGAAYLLGDSGYPLKNHLLTPYLNPVTAGERKYNEAHIKTRNVVERQYGVLKRRFPVLALGTRLKLQTAVTVIVACCILHNICILRKESEPINDGSITNLEDFITSGQIPRMPSNSVNLTYGSVRHRVTQYFEDMYARN